MKDIKKNNSYSTINNSFSGYNVGDRLNWYFEELKNWNINPETGFQLTSS